MRWLLGLAGLLVSLALALFQGGAENVAPEPPGLEFSGFEWAIKTSRGSISPGPNIFGGNAAWADARGRLHLSIAKENGLWICSEVVSKRSFGLGEYSFSVEASELDPNVVVGLFLWDSTARDQNFREVDIELSRWGEPGKVNAQFVKQPFVQPGNLDRFELPAGPAQLSFEWLPGRLSFRARSGAREVRGHVFASGVFGHGNEKVRLNAWLYRGAPPTDGKAVDVVVNNFSFLPIKKGK